MEIELFYDKECPFCNSYAKYIKLKESYDLKLLNAREHKSKLEEIEKKGFNINEGFLVIIDKKNIYQGVDAIIVLNDLAKTKVYFPDNYFSEI